jgi:hypothetical protein
MVGAVCPLRAGAVTVDGVSKVVQGPPGDAEAQWQLHRYGATLEETLAWASARLRTVHGAGGCAPALPLREDSRSSYPRRPRATFGLRCFPPTRTNLVPICWWVRPVITRRTARPGGQRQRW